MMTKILFSSIFLLLTLATGLWLTRLGRPYNIAIFTIHKLSTITFIVFSVLVLIKQAHRNGFSGTDMTFMIIAGLFVILLMVSGGILSAKKDTINILLITHKTLPLPTFAALAYLIFSVYKRI